MDVLREGRGLLKDRIVDFLQERELRKSKESASSKGSLMRAQQNRNITSESSANSNSSQPSLLASSRMNSPSPKKPAKRDEPSVKHPLLTPIEELGIGCASVESMIQTFHSRASSIAT